MSVPDQFTGYACMNEASGKKLDVESYSYKPQKWNEDLIDIKISHCSICGSCIHTLTNGWPSPTQYPAIAGHEIIGEVVQAGKNSGHKVGSRVGVGAQAGSCLECKQCKAGNEPFCEKGMVGTYQGKWTDGSVAQGGYADYVRVQGKFAIDIPKDLPSESAAPLMCAGVTTYAPVKAGGAGKGKKVAIVGIGGLGHLGLQWSNALGAETYAISHSDSKKNDAEKLGVKPEHFIIANDVEATVKKWSNTFDLIVCTSFAKELPLDNLYLPLLAPGGRITICGLPEDKIKFTPQSLVAKGLQLTGSIIGTTQDLKDMLDLAVKENVRAWVEVKDMKDTGKWLKEMEKGNARYRYCLKN